MNQTLDAIQNLVHLGEEMLGHKISSISIVVARVEGGCGEKGYRIEMTERGVMKPIFFNTISPRREPVNVPVCANATDRWSKVVEELGELIKRKGAEGGLRFDLMVPGEHQPDYSGGWAVWKLPRGWVCEPVLDGFITIPGSEGEGNSNDQPWPD